MVNLSKGYLFLKHETRKKSCFRSSKNRARCWEVLFRNMKFVNCSRKSRQSLKLRKNSSIAASKPNPSSCSAKVGVLFAGMRFEEIKIKISQIVLFIKIKNS